MFLLKLLFVGGIAYVGVETIARERRQPLYRLLNAPGLPGQPNRSKLAGRTWLARLRLPDWLVRAGQVDAPTDKTRQRTHIHLALALTSLGLTTAGSLGFALLTLVSVPGLIYLLLLRIRDAYLQVADEQRVGMALIDAIVATWLLTLGYVWALALYMSFFFFSRTIILQAQETYRQRLDSLIGSMPGYAWQELPEGEIYVPLAQIGAGDIVIVYPSETVPVDGEIVDGLAAIDQRTLTGEAQPAEKGPGDPVFAATLVLSGRIKVRVQQAGTATTAAQIGTILNNTANYTEGLTLRSEAVGDRNALLMIGLSAATGLLLGPASALTVLCSYIGYTMRIVGPLSVLNFLRVASWQQILVKDGRALELLPKVDTVVFDKTGTLTLEQTAIWAIYPLAPYSEIDVLGLAAAAEEHQTHPIALAILQAARERGVVPAPTDEISYEVGHGMRVRVDGQTVRVGSGRFMGREGIELPETIDMIRSYSARRGHSIVYVAVNDRLAGVIELRALLRPEAAQVVEALQRRGLAVHVVSGDNLYPTRQIAYDLGIEHYMAEALPEDKAALIDHLQQTGRVVCFVGDGINDSPAIKHARVGVSLHGAATFATETAQVLLLSGTLEALPGLFELADELEANMRVNLAASVVPGLLTIGGVYLLNFGLPHAYGLFYAGFGVGLANAMWPLVKRDELARNLPALPAPRSPESAI